MGSDPFHEFRSDNYEIRDHEIEIKISIPRLFITLSNVLTFYFIKPINFNAENYYFRFVYDPFHEYLDWKLLRHVKLKQISSHEMMH